jgi:hypothetical protein
LKFIDHCARPLIGVVVDHNDTNRSPPARRIRDFAQCGKQRPQRLVAPVRADCDNNLGQITHSNFCYSKALQAHRPPDCR